MTKKHCLIVVLVILVVMEFSFGLPTTRFLKAKVSSLTNQPPANGTESEDLPPVKSWKLVEDFDHEIAVFETVFWDPRDTESLRTMIRDSGLFKGKTVLEIGTGSGLLSLCCLQAGAKKVVATDVNPSAVANATFNAQRLKLAGRLDVRLVDLEDASAFSVIAADETFDFIISNPPWVNQKPLKIDEFALYDENFALMSSLFEGLDRHLNPNGRVLLAYGCVDAVRTLIRLANQDQRQITVRDTRNLDMLPEEFLPGMLVEIRR